MSSLIRNYELYVPQDIDAAYREWRATCGPAALAALAGIPVGEVRMLFPDYRGWVNPTGMREAVERISQRRLFINTQTNGDRPREGTEALLWIQFEGPWCAPHLPAGASYRHTHWIALKQEHVFDVNVGRSVDGPREPGDPRWLTWDGWCDFAKQSLVPAVPGCTGWWVRQWIVFTNQRISQAVPPPGRPREERA